MRNVNEKYLFENKYCIIRANRKEKERKLSYTFRMRDDR